MSWLLYAFISAAAAALTAILAKVGVEGVPSNLATAIRTLMITGFKICWRSGPVELLRHTGQPSIRGTPATVQCGVPSPGGSIGAR